MNDEFNNNLNDSNFILSHELLCLFNWLIKHDAEKLKKIISKALAHGLQEELTKINRLDNTLSMEEVQYSVIDFFNLFEVLLLEALDESVEDNARKRELIPAIDQIDSRACDDETIRSSLEKATNKMKLNPQANAKKLLFEEILKQWKPINKNNAN